MQCNGFGFYLSFVYGHPEPSQRNNLWEKLERYSTTRREPWFIQGDFNEILGNDEKVGGRLRPEVSFRDFRRMVRTCDFTDLKSTGDRFSWAGQRGVHYVSCCLDRTMGNSEWHSRYPCSETLFLELGESDHRPLVTFISDTTEERRGVFMYDSRMRDKDGFQEAVIRGWDRHLGSANADISFGSRIQNCRKEISRWKRNNRNNAQEKIKIIRHRLDKAMVSPLATTQERNRLREELNHANAEEEAFWKQKSRNNWLKAGDKNTKFFHSVTKARRIRNNLTTIEDEAGAIHRGDNAIGEVAEKYFQNLFTPQDVTAETFAQVFDGFERRVSTDINSDLIRAVTTEEIEEAAFSIGPHRASGPDGFSGAFYQQFWKDIKQSVIKEVQMFFQEGVLDPSHNQTNICLIPKVFPPKSMTDFRPISLCNVSYKIISKILVSRLKQHLSGIISENQAAFIPGRMITDNVIIEHEMSSRLKVKETTVEIIHMALKTDMAKAYDRLEWKFLEETMKAMGFDSKWIQWIMTCVSSVSFRVLINGSPKERVVKGRYRASNSVNINCPKINHLLFADDSLFFSLANNKSAKAIKEVLCTYEKASGQAVNLNKSAITFGSRVQTHVKSQMRRILGIHNEGGGGKYLGVPEQFGRKKTEMFQYIVEKVKERTQGWHKRFLSTGGKEVLLKSVAIALPVYSMNVFKLPVGICEEINSILAKFWWHTSEEGKGMHWFNWKRLCLPKKEGGIGFRDIESFNLALLGKQAWRILQNPECLMARVIERKILFRG
ncbi:unnamed protein product [Microthlaspi erraticum]|uniref:Reverse transcriptase domain-containing protein n=1 Tax=Microthlaspi erraticum TaxID=1685480 RepID=A0A6D2KI32_9BRAS|nr:unnamed protein product [Microthlaspi erraticum]